MDHRLYPWLFIGMLIGMTALISLIAAGNGGFLFSNPSFPASLTGASVANGSVTALCTGRSCVISCYNDLDCDDRMDATSDICRNPGTRYSLCVNKAIWTVPLK